MELYSRLGITEAKEYIDMLILERRGGEYCVAN
jgi:hypothetical protein